MVIILNSVTGLQLCVLEIKLFSELQDFSTACHSSFLLVLCRTSHTHAMERSPTLHPSPKRLHNPLCHSIHYLCCNVHLILLEGKGSNTHSSLLQQLSVWWRMKVLSLLLCRCREGHCLYTHTEPFSVLKNSLRILGCIRGQVGSDVKSKHVALASVSSPLNCNISPCLCKAECSAKLVTYTWKQQ